MSSGTGSRIYSTSSQYGGEGDQNKRKKPYFPSSTRRDFKSSGPEPMQSSQSRPSLASERRVSGDLPNRQRYRDMSRESVSDYRDSGRDVIRDSSWDTRDVVRDSTRDVNRDVRDRHPRDFREQVSNRDPSRDHKDVSLFNSSMSSTQNPVRNPRSNNYTKDYRYGNYKQYSSSYNSFSERNGAYGSFSGNKRLEQDYFSSNYSSRDASNRDDNNSRDSWRTEKPRQGAPSRFNPNNIPVTLRNNLGSLVSSTNNDYKKDRYDNYEDNYSGRWNSYSRRSEAYPRTEKLNADNVSRPSFNRDRLHGSSLTNSVNPQKRPSKSFSSYQVRHMDHYPNGYMGRGTSNHSPEIGHTGGSSQDLNGMQRDLHDGSLAGPEVSPHEIKIQVDEANSAYVTHDNHNTHSILNGRYEVTRASSGTAAANSNIKQEFKEANDFKESHDDEIKYEDTREGVEDEDDDEEDDEEEEEEEEDDVDDDDEVEEDEEIVADESKESIASDLPVQVVLPNTSEGSQGAALSKLSIVDNKPAFNADLEPIMYPDGCLNPKTRLQAELEALEIQFHNEKLQPQIFVNGIIHDFKQYRFYTLNLDMFVSKYDTLSQLVKESLKTSRRHQLSLWREYEAFRKENAKRVAMMDEQLRVIHPGDDEATRELLAIDTRPKTGIITPQSLTQELPPTSGRRNRRHGDLVTTEAEFQEILKTLENEEKESPVAKALRVAATIPDLIVDPIKRDAFKFMDSNNFVFNKQKWANRVNTDFEDTFTEKEHDMFCDAYCQFPKKFGQIARAMGGLRLSQECVLHYYMTKKAVNYKLLMAQYKKRARTTIRRKKKKAVAVPSSEASFVKEDSLLQGDGGLNPNTEEPLDLDPLQDHDIRKRPADNLESPISDEQNLKKVKIANSGSEPSSVPLKASEFLLTASPGEQEVEDMEDDEDIKDDELKDDEKRRNISSYWSITETNEFPHLLNQFGSQWSKIAEKLATKTATMVRNQYQRKGKKYGWTKVVAAADQRLARKPYVAGENRYSKFDTTLIVKPQKSTNAVVQNTEIHVYDTVEQAAVAQGATPPGFVSPRAYSVPEPLDIATGESPTIDLRRISVSKLMGSPLIAGSGSFVDQNPEQISASAQRSLPGIQNVVSFQQSSNSANSYSVVDSKKEPSSSSVHAKPSIMNLLNGESPLRETSVTSETLPPVRANIASLLNTPSSPAAPSFLPSAPESSSQRNNIINSLLG